MAISGANKGETKLAVLIALTIMIMAAWLGINIKQIWLTAHANTGNSDQPNRSSVPPKDPGIGHEPESTNWLTLDQTHWQGVTCFDPDKVIVGHMITRGVVWQQRCDHSDDTNLTFTFFPADWKTNSVAKVPPANSSEWRIRPGEATTSAVLCVCIIDKKHLTAEHQKLIKPIY